MARLYMQNDLISRSALKKTFEDAELGEHSLIESVLAAGVYAGIDDAPTIDAVPVVHARWVHGVTLGHEWRKCSACLVSQGIFGCFTYCPNCGAKMDGGKSDDA